MLIKRGATRIVFIFRKFVIKVPNFTYSYRNFIRGILSNIDEDRTWRWNSGKYENGKSHLLCPVIFSLWGGWLLIMARADVLKWSGDVRALPHTDNPNDVYKEWIEAGLGGDDKADNYGYYKGRLVKVDYA
jgi:hypothetical protein